MSNKTQRFKGSPAANSIDQFDHVVFFGTFNADPFRRQIEKWLTELDLTDVALYVSDNNSSDSTVQWIQELTANLQCFSVVTVNKRNFGGYGNLAMNLDNLKHANWITTLHQDDQYSPEHVQSHRRAITSADDKVGMICSEAVSITPEGKELGYPRLHWLLEEKSDPVTVFLAHLRNHAYPFSGATFSNGVLSRYPIPWHSTAFPDTEIVMKMAAEYKTVMTDKVTVRYLENPNSESHSLETLHRDFGAFQALLRVFAHPNYKKICDLVSTDAIPKFLKSLDEGISLRIHDPDFCEILKHSAFEMTAENIGPNPEVASYLAEGYLRVGDTRAIQTLRSLGASIPHDLRTGQLGATSRDGDSSPTQRLSWPLRASAFIPRWLRKFAFKAFMRTKTGKAVLASWDIDWTAN